MKLEDAVNIVSENLKKTKSNCVIESANERNGYWIITSLCSGGNLHIDVVEEDSGKIVSSYP